MLELFPRVTLADRPTEFVITDSKKRFEEGLKIHIAVQSMEKYNVPHSEIYRIDEQQRFIGFDVYVKGGKA